MPAAACYSPGREMKARVLLLFGLLLAANAAAWAAAFAVFGDRPALLGTALLAWGFGLRHAVDADHIAAIDNVTRKLRGEGRRPLTVGLFFALGHSTVVMLAAAGIAATASLLSAHFEQFREIGGVLGTTVSALFLFAIAAVNLVTFKETWRAWRANDASATAANAGAFSFDGGLLARICRPLFGLIERPWHMFPLGFLFGLGFDTATEVSLLGLSATGAAQGMSLWAILVFPALFAAGMALVDTADGVLMLGAYDFAFARGQSRPRARLAYNLVITGASAAVAILVGGLELLGVELGNLGFAIVAFFAVAWAAAFALSRRTATVDVQAD